MPLSIPILTKSSRKMSIPMGLEKISKRYWILPTLISLGIIGLLPLTLSYKADPASFLLPENLWHKFSADSAKQALSSIATALMTVVGVLFSITIVVIQQASSHFSPRVIDIFIKGRTNQIVLGLFIGTFIYCILLLSQLPGGSSGTPQDLQFPIQISLILSIGCMAFLVNYIHSLAHSIKANNIVKNIVQDALEYLYSYKEFLSCHEVDLDEEGPDQFLSYSVCAQQFGYLQFFNPDKLQKLLKHEICRVEILYKVGDYLQKGQPIATVYSPQKATPKLLKKLQDCFEIGPERTHAQDIRYGLKQLSDMALRGLSPGINEPSTAIEALNGIGTIMIETIRTDHIVDQLQLGTGLRLKFQQASLEELLMVAFNDIHVFARESHFPVLVKMRDLLKYCLRCVHSEEQASAVREVLHNVCESLEEVDGREYYARDESKGVNESLHH